jgi:hypothetical protein
MISERLARLEKALAVMREKAPNTNESFQFRLINTSNGREHWRVVAKRAKLHRAAIKVRLRAPAQNIPLVSYFRPETRFFVRLVYVGPRQLDDDGVASAVKSLRDGVADALGVDDRDPRVVWVPDQERGGVREYGARVEIYLG